MNEVEKKEYMKNYYQSHKKSKEYFIFSEINDNQINSMQNEYSLKNIDYKYPIYLEALKFVEMGYDYNFSLKVVLSLLNEDLMFKYKILNTSYVKYCKAYYEKHRKLYNKEGINNDNKRIAYYL